VTEMADNPKLVSSFFFFFFLKSVKNKKKKNIKKKKSPNEPLKPKLISQTYNPLNSKPELK
jgi:hypothetical protein